jgi:hypothetical protein
MSFDILTNHGRTVSHWGVDNADVLEYLRRGHDSFSAFR